MGEFKKIPCAPGARGNGKFNGKATISNLELIGNLDSEKGAIKFP